MTPPKIIYIVITTIAFLAVVYLLGLTYIAIMGIPVEQTSLQSFNHAGDVLLGFLGGILVKTSVTPDKPQETVIVNKENNPVQVEDKTN